MKPFLRFVAAVLFVAYIFCNGQNTSSMLNVSLEIAHTTCVLGSEIKSTTIKDALDGIFANDPHLPPYFQCMFRMYGLLDYDGNLKNDSVYEAVTTFEIDHYHTDVGIEACLNETLYANMTQGDIPYEFFMCFRNNTEDSHYWSILQYILHKLNNDNIPLTHTQSLKLETVHFTCTMAAEIQLKPIKNALKGIYTQGNNLTEYFQCVFKMYGYIDTFNHLKNMTMLNSIPALDKDRLRTEEAIISCQDVAPEDPDETAYEFFKCFRNATESAEYWVVLKELSSKDDKPDMSNLISDFLL